MLKPPMQELHALDQEWQAAKCKFCGGRGECAGWRRHLRESESGSGIVPIREASMQRREPHTLDQYGNQWTPQWFTRRWALQDIPKLQPMRLALPDSGAERNILTFFYANLANLAAALNYLHRRESGSGIVPIREARMLRQEPHPLDQHGNQWIPRFHSRRALQDIPKLQPMRAAVADSGAECNFLSLSYARLCSLDRHPDGGLRIMRTLRCHESHRLKQIETLDCYYALLSLCSGAVPTYNARLSRRRPLNALRRRDDNSQCSELREWECHDWYLFSMALMVLGIDGSDPLLRDQIETYFREYFLPALSGVTEGGFSVERSGHVRRYEFGVGSRIGATSSRFP